MLQGLDTNPTKQERLAPTYQTVASQETERVSLQLDSSSWDSERIRLLVPFIFNSNDPKPFAPTIVEVSDNAGRSHPVEVTHVTKPGADGAITSVGFQERVEGVIAIDLGGASSINSLRIRFSEPNRTRWVLASIDLWTIQRVIVQAYTQDDWLRDVKKEEARKARAKQLIIGPTRILRRLLDD